MYKIWIFILALFLWTGVAVGQLCEEIRDDPLGRNYAAKSNGAILGDLKKKVRPINRPTMTGRAMLNAVNTTELNALSPAQQQLFWNVLHLGEVNPHGKEFDLLEGAFGPGSATITELKKARIKKIDRTEELGLGHVTIGDIEGVRGRPC